ncbi:hypothetical protein HDU82_006051 [Entophlyctis luteolus]|nr:hypothetical protein HDU82_006051 [Entophlyctis luteolus]
MFTNHSFPAFDDLLYIFSKYLLLSSFQKGDVVTAQKLLVEGIQRHVQAQLTKNPSRGAWFEEDFRMLWEYVQTRQHNPSTSNYNAKNAYSVWDWAKELENFWGFAEQPELIPGTAPLYAMALNIAFPIRSSDSAITNGDGAGAGISISLQDAFRAFAFQKEFEAAISKSSVIQTISTEFADPSISHNPKGQEKHVPQPRKR